MSNSVAVQVESLIIGRLLPCPIHALDGTLLLNEGELLTSSHKRRMLARGAKEVLIPEEFASRVALFGGDPQEVARYERELNAFVDEALRSGAFNVKNSGPAVADGVVDHGRDNYSPVHQEAVRQNLQTGEVILSEVLADVVQIGKSDSDALRELTESWTQLFTKDFGGSINTSLAYQNDNALVTHAMKMASLGMAMAIEMKYDADNVAIVGISGLLADIGMAQIPQEFRQSARRLSPEEFAQVQRHVVYTANYVERIPGIPDLTRVVVYQVHERPDGTGYPRGRSGNAIHPFARILNVADAYVAMITARPFRNPMMPYAAMKQLLMMAHENKADRLTVRALLKVLSLFPIGSYVTLNDGSVAQVMRSNGQQYMSPLVARVQTATGEAVTHDDAELLIDLDESELEIVQALPRPGSNEVNLEGVAAGATTDICYA